MVALPGSDTKLLLRKSLVASVQCAEEANLLFSRSISAEISERVESSFEEA
jgi:hypothetical protein